MKKYSSPKIEVQSFQLNDKIADTCWGYTANGTGGSILYYNTAGKGFVSFLVDHHDTEECKKDHCGHPIVTNVVYYPTNGAPGQTPTSAQITEVQNKVSAKANAGQPFKGQKSLFPESPGDWS